MKKNEYILDFFQKELNPKSNDHLLHLGKSIEI